MFEIIESYRPFFETEKEQKTKKLHNLLETLIHHKQKIPTIDLFKLIYQLFDLQQQKQDIFEKVGPYLELKFGDKQCCSYKSGIDPIAGSECVMPRRCERRKLPGFLYCQQHHEIEIKTCLRCRQHFKRDIIHHFGWEHFGNIFESQLRPQTWTKIAEQLQIDYRKLISFSNTIFGEKSCTNNTVSSKPIVSCREKITTSQLSASEKQQMSLHLLQYMLSSNAIKVCRKHPLTEIRLFDMEDDNDVFLDDGYFIFKMVLNKCRVVGIRKNGDSVLMKDQILNLKPAEGMEITDDKILNFTNI